MSDLSFWPFAADGIEDPYPAYAAERAHAPLRAVPSQGLWLATGHRQVRTLLSDPRCAAGRIPSAEVLGGGRAALGMPLRRTLERMAVLSDAPRHERLRRPLQRAFAPHVVAPLRPRVRDLAGTVLDRALEASGGADVIDLVGAVADPLLAELLDGLLRLQPGEGAMLRRWWDHAAASFEGPEPVVPPGAVRRLLDIHEQLTLHVRRVRSDPAGAPIDALLHAAADDPELSEADLVANLAFLLTSGHRAPAHALGLAAHALARHPDELARLRARPDLVPNAVEELLRFDAPVQLISRRLVGDTTLNGESLPAGDLVVAVVGAANRDPAAFSQAERLDVGARAARHVSFGYGPHFCAGAALARIVLGETIAAMLARAPTFELAGAPEWATSRQTNRGFARLPLHLVRADRPLLGSRGMRAAQPSPGGRRSRLAPEAQERVRAITGLDVHDLLALEAFGERDPVVVYLSGSLVAGHGNPWSDIDLFAITDRNVVGPFPREATTNLTSSHFLEGRRVDFEFWRREKVEELAARLAAHRFGTGESIPGASFLQIEEIFMHRLRIAVPVLDAEGLADLQALFDFERLAAFQAEEAMRHLDVEVEDLIGMRKGEDRDVALWVARQVLDVSVDAYLHSQGSTDPVHKWRVKHLAALEDTPRHRELREDYWRLQLPGPAAELRGNGDAWHAYVEEVLRFSERVAAWAQGS